MEYTHKGKYFNFLCFLVILASFAIVTANSSSLKHPQEQDHIEVNREEVLLNKLEELVRNLSEIVSKLEPILGDSLNMLYSEKRMDLEIIQSGNRYWGDEGSVDSETVVSEGRVRDGEKGKVVSVTKYSPFWSERFQFISAVKLDSDVTCVSVLPFRDFEGNSKFVAVGDDRGRIYVFMRNGDVLTEFYTASDSPVTAMASYLSVHKNESILVTGHQNGMVLVHKLYEGSNGEEMSTLFIENVGKFVDRIGGSAVTILEVHHVGRSRYILSSDASGEIWVLRENGTIHGSARVASRPLAFLKQRLLFLTESGAGSLDLRTMKVQESECEGLNHSLARNYAFDATERSKAYGYTSDGDLIHVLLLGDIMNFKCRVRSKRKFDIDEPLAFQVIKGYMLVANREKVFVYNTSSHHYVRVGGPRLLLSTGLEEIKSSFLNHQLTDVESERRMVIPLIASDREKLVVLGLGGGCVGMYRSNLPVFKGEFNTMLWTSPVLFFILFLFGAWQFFAKKKEALTSWGPDDPFSYVSATTAAPSLAPSSGDKAFVDSSSRTGDIMELRSNSLMAPPRRYGSPPRYPGGTTGTYRPTSADSNPRPGSIDPSYRSSAEHSGSIDPCYKSSAELKYRGPTLDSTGFNKRRENPYMNNQNIDDNSKL